MTIPVNQTPRFLRLPAVESKTGLKKSQLQTLETRGAFPKRVKISDRASGWIESEVDAWIAARIAASRKRSNNAETAAA